YHGVRPPDRRGEASRSRRRAARLTRATGSSCSPLTAAAQPRYTYAMLGPARRAIAALVGAAAFAAVGAADAQSSSADADAQAREEFLIGHSAFHRGNYIEAVRHFERAYELSNLPELLYNMGTSYDRLHRWVEARDAFRRYLELSPDAPQRDEV